QAEDGIRDFHVTGVQTCALPISTCSNTMKYPMALAHCRITRITEVFEAVTSDQEAATDLRYEMECTEYDGEDWRTTVRRAILERSEERRVGYNLGYSARRD